MVNDTQLSAQPPLKRAKQDATPTDAQFQHRAWWPAPLPGNDGDLLPRYLSKDVAGLFPLGTSSLSRCFSKTIACLSP